jgi:hypothetical protein
MQPKITTSSFSDLLAADLSDTPSPRPHRSSSLGLGIAASVSSLALDQLCALSDVANAGSFPN